MPRYRQQRRRGGSAIELIMVLVVLIVATFVSLQFGIALIVKQAVAEAATVAVREAAKVNPANPDELETIIERVLAGHQITLGSQASFVLEGQGLPAMRGSLPCTPPALPMLDGDEVRVTVCVSLAVHPILNILKGYGINFEGRKFSISSVATKE